MPEDTTLNDKAWRRVFEGTDLLSEIKKNGFSQIQASKVEELGQRQPRLMAKLDSLSSRPSIFIEHGLNMLPVGRGKYVIFEDPENRCYFVMPPLQPERRMIKFTPSGNINLSRLETLSHGICTTESEAIEIAHLSSLLNSFCDTENLVLTRRGRFGSNEFLLELPSRGGLISVNKAQIEVDAIFESEDVVLLIEAKIGFQTDFHIRQLYYPHIWLFKQTRKRIVPLLLCYSNGEFQLTEFFLGADFANIHKLRQEYFVIDEDPIAHINLKAILRHLPTATELLSVPFPQADDFEKVIDMLSALREGLTELDELAERFGFVSRQAGYYLNAAKYLSLVDHQSGLTRAGEKILDERNRVNRTDLLLKAMLARVVPREAILLLREGNFDPSTIATMPIESMISTSRSGEYSDDTITRRANSIRSWLKWLLLNCNFIGS